MCEQGERVGGARLKLPGDVRSDSLIVRQQAEEVRANRLVGKNPVRYGHRERQGNARVAVLVGEGQLPIVRLGRFARDFARNEDAEAVGRRHRAPPLRDLRTKSSKSCW